MKKNSIFWGPVLLALALAAFVARPAVAQQTSQSQGSQGTNSVDARLNNLSKELNLTDQQKAQLRPILSDESQQMQAIHNDTSLSREQKMAKMKEVRDSHQPQINQILTPEQQRKWAEMKKEAREKHEQNQPPQK
jgi:Spy/CpxP family protein refolding chaperone